MYRRQLFFVRSTVRRIGITPHLPSETDKQSALDSYHKQLYSAADYILCHDRGASAEELRTGTPTFLGGERRVPTEGISAQKIPELFLTCMKSRFLILTGGT